MKRCLPALLPFLITASAANAGPVEYLKHDSTTEGTQKIVGTRLPFSPAVRVGDVLYLSGQIGVRPDGTLPEGMEAQARQTMDNIGAILKKAGRGWNDVFRCMVMLDNMADWPAFNRIYVQYFNADRLPARSALGADGLALGALVEVECQAYAPEEGKDR